MLFFFSSRRRHTRSLCDWSSDVCSSDLGFVALDFVAGLFEPLGDGAFKNAFPHLGHKHVNGHRLLLVLPAAFSISLGHGRQPPRAGHLAKSAPRAAGNTAPEDQAKYRAAP